MDDENAVYSMEYCSAPERSEIVSFAGKQMELEKIILSEVTQP